MHQLLEKIMKEQTNFPAAQRLVAAYVVDNCYQIPFLSITALAKNVGVSDTTVIKFCAQLGFDGYGEFKKVFSDSVHSELVMYNKVAESDTPHMSGSSIFATINQEELANIQATMNNPTNHDSLEKLLLAMEKAENIYMMGGRSATYFAEYLANSLRYLGLPVQTLTGGSSDHYDRVFNIKPTDLVITFCFPRYTALTIELMQELHSQGIPQILITDTGLSPAYPYADTVFQCSVSSDGYFPCYGSCMALIDVISRAASVRFKATASEHIHRLEKRLLEKGVFSPYEKGQS